MINLGVIGTGAMGQNHARVGSTLPDCKLAGVFDLDKAVCKRVAKRVGTNHFTDFTKFLKAVDAVTVATPTTTHHKVAKQALEAGKHVMVEKPICSDATQAEELCELASQLGLTLAVGHIERHNPVVTYAKTLIEEGLFGEILSLAGKRVGGPVMDRVRDVGVIFDLGIHEIDNSRYLTGAEIEAVGAFGGSHSHRFEDYITLTLALSNGACANIEINWLTPMKIRKIDLTCSKSFVELDYINQKLQVSSARPQEYDVTNLFYSPWEFNTQVIPMRKQEPLKLEIQDFISAINRRAAPLVTGVDGLAAVKVASAAVQAYKTRRVIDVREL